MKRRNFVLNFFSFFSFFLKNGKANTHPISALSDEKLSTPVEPTKAQSSSRSVNIVIGYGQSNMTGREFTQMTSTYEEIDPSMLMFNSKKPSVRLPRKDDRLFSESIVGFTVLRSITDKKRRLGPTSLEGIAKSMTLDHQGSLYNDSKIKKKDNLFFTAARAGYSIAKLASGTEAYAELIESLTIAKKLVGTGVVIKIPFLIFTQGESDAGNRSWLHQVRRLQRDLERDLEFITDRKQKLRFILTQPSSFGKYSCALQHLQLVERYSDHFAIATPGYALSYSTDLLHFDSVGNLRKGEYEYKVMKAWYENGVWTGLRPKSILWNNDRHIEIEFFIPKPPLVQDPSSWGIENWGFSVYEDSVDVAINNLEIINGLKIRITLSRALSSSANRIVSYGMRSYRRDSTNKRLALTGPVGQIRDSDSSPSFIDGKPLYNWLVHFRKKF